MGGLVSHIFLSIDSDLILSLFSFSHFLDISFCFKNPKMSVPLLVPHQRFLSWAPSCRAAAACECTVGEEEVFGLCQGALTLAVVFVEQQSISQ